MNVYMCYKLIADTGVFVVDPVLRVNRSQGVYGTNGGG